MVKKQKPVQSMRDLVKELMHASEDKAKTFSAEVSHTDDEGVVWVRLPGSNQDTPTASTSAEVKMGDVVNVEWRNSKLYIAGNYSNPSAGVSRVESVEQAASRANAAATQAVNDAIVAQAAAESAQASAASAETAANAAQASATNASEYAARALGNLSTVQSVTETLAWITQHGTMTLTTDIALDPTHVYFVQDAQGDYVVGGQHYAVVSEPSASALSTYYVLSIDESLNNYVAVHLAVTDEGLWLLPDAGGNKVLIATGSGTTYTSAGTYIIGAGGAVLASFLASGAQIGQTGQSRIEMDYHSLQLKDKEGNSYFHVSDLRDKNGEITLTEDNLYAVSSSTDTRIIVSYPIKRLVSITVNGLDWLDKVDSISGKAIIVTQRITGPASIIAVYVTESPLMKAYTLGLRKELSDIGPMSVCEGYETTASGRYSHAEGVETTAIYQGSHAEGAETTAYHGHAEGYRTISRGDYSHAEGSNTNANGYASHSEGYETTASGGYAHAQNRGTIASGSSQTAIGKWNDNKQNNAFEIGNGSADNTRSNCFEVDWYGNTKAAGNITDGSGNVLADKVSPYELLDLIYPVGAIYLSTVATSPATLFGGTWERIQDQFLLAAGTTYAAGATGGAATHKHTTGDHKLTAAESGIPSHGHTYTRPTVSSSGKVDDGITGGTHGHTVNYRSVYSGGSNYSAVTPSNGTATSTGVVVSTSGSHKHDLPNHTHTLTGGGVADATAKAAESAHNHGNTGSASNLPPYIAVYAWKRTA